MPSLAQTLALCLLVFFLGYYLGQLAAAPPAPLPSAHLALAGAAAADRTPVCIHGAGITLASTDPPPAADWRKGYGGPPYHSSSVLEYRGFFQRLARWGFQPAFILDVGANEGNWAQEVYMEMGYSPTILCVEGSSRREEALSRLGFDFVISLVGPQEGHAEFFDNEGWANTGNSVLKERTSFYAATQPTLTPMRTIDGLMEEYRQAEEGREGVHPTLLKLDVQGFELQALKGAKDTLSHVEVLILETSLLQYNVGSPLLGEVVIALDCLGFQALDVLGLQRTGPEQVIIQEDFAFVRKGSPLIDRASAGAGIGRRLRQGSS